MAVITDSNMRHVRKTITLDGSANNGNLGDFVTAFTPTGRVRVVAWTAYVSDGLVCAAGGATSIWPYAGAAPLVEGGATVDGGSTGTWLSDGYFDSDTDYGGVISLVPFSTGSAIGFTIVDDTGGADVTAGTIIVDIWYLPITNDGALAGDDIDTGYIPVNVGQVSGDSTAADRLESLMDGIVAGTVGTGSTITSIANCTGFTEATNDHYNGRLITFLTGSLAGQQTQITDYAGSTQTFTCPALTEAPGNGDTFVIH